jgi:hypothetical protein
MSRRSLRFGHLIDDKEIQMGELSRLGWVMDGMFSNTPHAIWADSFYFLPMPAVAFNLRNSGFIPDDRMTLLVGMLG